MKNTYRNSLVFYSLIIACVTAIACAVFLYNHQMPNRTTPITTAPLTSDELLKLQNLSNTGDANASYRLWDYYNTIKNDHVKASYYLECFVKNAEKDNQLKPKP